MQIETEIKASPHRTYFMTNEGIGSTSIGGGLSLSSYGVASLLDEAKEERDGCVILF